MIGTRHRGKNLTEIGEFGLQAFDIEPSSGFFHYAFYLLATTLLGWIAGLGWVWDVVQS